MFSINFANDWIPTADLWYWKQPLYQLSHNHYPTELWRPPITRVIIIIIFPAVVILAPKWPKNGGKKLLHNLKEEKKIVETLSLFLKYFPKWDDDDAVRPDVGGESSPNFTSKSCLKVAISYLTWKVSVYKLSQKVTTILLPKTHWK